ncbi:hypothetical protein [Peribacillus asahii]|nr:hypothetical protein [Peribacillus asahii]
MSLQFAYWAPNVSGGLVISQLSQRTGWSFKGLFEEHKTIFFKQAS